MKKSGVLLSLVFLFCEGLSAAVIHVPSDYPTIQEAINAAQKWDNVVVAPGTYAESIVMKENVDVTGSGTDVTTITSNGPVVKAASSSTLSDFTIVGNNSGIKCQDATSFHIYDVVVNPVSETGRGNNSVYGISLDNCADAVIYNSTIGNITEDKWGYAVGIRITNSSGVVLYYNTIENITDDDWDYAAGIFVNNSSDITILKNTIYNIHDEEWKSAYGIYASGTNLSLINNLIYNITETLWDNAYGIYSSGSLNTILNNVVNQVTQTAWGNRYGIYNNATDTKISNNVVINTGNGIHDAAEGNDVSYNNVWQASYGGNISGPGNLNVEPMFVGGNDLSERDYYQLQSTSPMIDTGDPDSMYNDSDGSRNNMGLFGGSFTYEVSPLLVELDSFAAEAVDGTVVVAWETASEIDNAGFVLWRAEPAPNTTCHNTKIEDYGNIMKLTFEPTKKGGLTEGDSYSYEDSAVESGKNYCYALQDVSFAGETTLHLDKVASVKVVE